MISRHEDSDTLLLTRVRQGDPGAFSQLSLRHRSKLFSISLRILRNREEAEDNTQSTLLRAYLHCDKFRGASQFSTWLIRVAINEALMRLRRFDRHKEVSLESTVCKEVEFIPHRVVSYGSDQERRYIAQDLTQKLCACLSRSLREPFVLYTVEGWSQEELSLVFGVPTQTIKSRIYRAREQLREQWPKYV